MKGTKDFPQCKRYCADIEVFEWTAFETTNVLENELLR